MFRDVTIEKLKTLGLKVFQYDSMEDRFFVIFFFVMRDEVILRYYRFF